METRAFGPNGWPFGVLGFGCGAVGGLMVRGTAADQERAIARALDVGINYFDTAVQYGDGISESNLGAILQKLKPRQAFVGTKVRIPPAEYGRIGAYIAASLEASLKRLRMERVDIIHLHNPITEHGGEASLTVTQVMEEVLPAFEAAQRAGQIDLPGITAVGDTPALLEAIDSGAFGSAQVSYNLLNPSAARALPPGYPAQDYGQIFDHTRRAKVGVIGIRVLAAGALSGSMDRHPLASTPPAPIGSAHSYEGDVERAKRLVPLVEEGYASSLPEAAVRFAITNPAMGCILVGMASVGEFEDALAAVQKGPLPEVALRRIAELSDAFVGEAR